VEIADGSLEVMEDYQLLILARELGVVTNATTADGQGLLQLVKRQELKV
jgi:hypothetical protein